jgi:hypothetical protein
MPNVIPWKTPPQMDVGAPLPSIKIYGESLFVCYVCHNLQFPGWDKGATVDHPGFDIYSAVLRFDGVTWHHFGAPGDEGLHAHPLYSFGLRPYGFWEVLDSPQKTDGKRYWIATFHDQTLEVVAESARVVTERHDGEETHETVLKYARPNE